MEEGMQVHFDTGADGTSGFDAEVILAVCNPSLLTTPWLTRQHPPPRMPRGR